MTLRSRVTADADDHTATTVVAVNKLQGGVWIRCRTCGDIHYAEEATVGDSE